MAFITRNFLSSPSRQSACPIISRLRYINISTIKLQQKEDELLQQKDLKVTTENEWTTIYRLPLIRLAAAFNRLKIYQGIITATGAMGALAMEQAGHLGENTTAIFAATGVSGFLTLSLSSLAVRNLIGFIYINRSGDQLKLSYVDYWGRRKNALIDIHDLIPEWEQERPSRFNFYQMIRLRNDVRRKYKLLQRFGVIVEPEIFAGLFGE